MLRRRCFLYCFADLLDSAVAFNFGTVMYFTYYDIFTPPHNSFHAVIVSNVQSTPISITGFSIFWLQLIQTIMRKGN